MSKARRSSSQSVCSGLVAALAFVGSFAGAPRDAAAEGPSGDKAPGADKAVCLSKHVEAQVSRRAHHLLEAREALLACAREDCPGAIRADCGEWLREVKRELPSVLLRAASKRGDETETKVSIDGVLVTTALDGRAIDIDPGPHLFRFELPPYEPIEQKIVVQEGERGRTVSVTFAPLLESAPPAVAPPPPPVAPPPVATHRPVPWPVFALGGLAVAGGTVFAGFALSGRTKHRDLEQRCQPFCAADEVDTVKRRFLVADVALGAGVVSAGAALTVFLLRPSEPLATEKASSATSFSVTPVSGGWSAGASGSF